MANEARRTLDDDLSRSRAATARRKAGSTDSCQHSRLHATTSFVSKHLLTSTDSESTTFIEIADFRRATFNPNEEVSSIFMYSSLALVISSGRFQLVTLRAVGEVCGLLARYPSSLKLDRCRRHRQIRSVPRMASGPELVAVAEQSARTARPNGEAIESCPWGASVLRAAAGMHQPAASTELVDF